MGRKPSGERVCGPYLEGGAWRIYIYGPGGKPDRRRFTSEGAASSAAEKIRRAIQAVEALTVAGAVDEYRKHLLDEKGNKEHSVNAQVYRLKSFFAGHLELQLCAITPAKCDQLYTALRTRPRAPRKDGAEPGAPPSVDTHRNILNAAKSLMTWCVGKGFLPASPAAAVKGIGKRHHGKAQLRIDEARRWTTLAIALADQGEAGAVAALATLLLNLRASEVVSRQVRDLDDHARLLWIPCSKTPAGRRTLQVPRLLRRYLARLAGRKKPQDLLFGGPHWRDWPREWVQRICRQAEVPVVTAHGMRGLHASLAMERGATGHAVALAMGHSSEAITRQSYATPEAQAKGLQDAALAVLIPSPKSPQGQQEDLKN